MRIKERRFSVPFCAMDDGLPDKAFRVLCFLFSESDFSGCCDPGYDAIKRFSEIGSDATVISSLRLLEKKGWIFSRKKGGCKTDKIWVQVPPRYRAKQRVKKPNPPVIVLQSVKNKSFS